MKISFALCMILVMLTVSCKKSNEQTNTLPVVDTVKPPVISPDTSTLVKSSTIYNLDAAGINPVDSTFYHWTYDNLRRIVNQTFAGANYNDTFYYTYLNDRYVISSNSYLQGALVLKTNVIYFQQLKDHTDSIITTSVGYGIQAGVDVTTATYFYYNQSGQDSLEKSYNVINPSSYFSYSVNNYYTGSNLDSAIGRDNNGKLTYIKYFTGGKMSAESTYGNGNDIQTGALSFTYSDISSGGLFISLGASKLMTGYTSVTMPATNTFTESNTYQFDSVQRVTVILRNHHGSSPNQKQVFTYY
jgi:hypothetical protein